MGGFSMMLRPLCANPDRGAQGLGPAITPSACIISTQGKHF
jgi:hypothetical protein